MIEEKYERTNSSAASKGRRVWKWVFISLVDRGHRMATIGEVVLHRAMPILKGRVIETLSTRLIAGWRWMASLFQY